LENTLIKQHSPKYNIALKDGKTYPVVRITNEQFPKVFRTRHIIEDGSKYFGPFPNLKYVDDTLELLQKIYPIRKCRRYKKRDNPCIYYHMGRCNSPCCEKITQEAYRENIAKIEKLLSGDMDSFIKDVQKKMEEAAVELRFEKAAELRDAINAIKGLLQQNDANVIDNDSSGRDYIAFSEEASLITFSVFSMREGKLTGRQLFRSRSAADEDDSIETFMMNFYHELNLPPASIYISKLFYENGEDENDFTNIKEWFKSTFDIAAELCTPESKHDMAIMSMARQNAIEDIRLRVKERGGGPALEELMNVLNLPTLPLRIEGFDIAQLDGKHPVSSLISFKNGIPDKSNYRLFKLRSVEGIIDDFAAMREAVQRRYTRLLREHETGSAELPDLILIDGGIGQVNAAKEILDDLHFNCPVVGLAKREEELWLPNASSPIVLPRRSDALKLLQAVRDETHRFATNANQRLRSHDLLLSSLESIEGIGKNRASKIMRAVRSLNHALAMKADGLASQAQIPQALAEKVLLKLKSIMSERNADTEFLRAGLKGESGERLTSYRREKERKTESLVENAMAAEPDVKWED
jgi:excinuclease ABC subunit C